MDSALLTLKATTRHWCVFLSVHVYFFGVSVRGDVRKCIYVGVVINYGSHIYVCKCITKKEFGEHIRRTIKKGSYSERRSRPAERFPSLTQPANIWKSRTYFLPCKV